jgi:hypothetical protein
MFLLHVLQIEFTHINVLRHRASEDRFQAPKTTESTAGEQLAVVRPRSKRRRVIGLRPRPNIKRGLRGRSWFDNLSAVMNPETAKFADALASVESLAVEDQAVLVEVVSKRIAATRRREMAREISKARADYRRGNVKRGSASDLMRELRGK